MVINLGASFKSFILEIPTSGMQIKYINMFIKKANFVVFEKVSFLKQEQEYCMSYNFEENCATLFEIDWDH